MTRPVSLALLGVALLGAALPTGCGRPLSDYERPESPAKAADVTRGGDWMKAKPDASATVRGILVQWKGAASARPFVSRNREQALLRARTLSNVLRGGGGDFASLSREYSDDRVAFGERRTVKKGEGTYPPAAEDVALRLEVGQISRPVETPMGYFVLERVADPTARPVVLERIRAKHILVSYAGARGADDSITRTQEEAKALAEKVRREALAAPDEWDELAQMHTDEPGAQDGGDLGYFGRGAMVPPFEHAAFKLKVNEVSQVVETPFGYHVILRTE